MYIEQGVVAYIKRGSQLRSEEGCRGREQGRAAEPQERPGQELIQSGLMETETETCCFEELRGIHHPPGPGQL